MLSLQECGTKFVPKTVPGLLSPSLPYTRTHQHTKPSYSRSKMPRLKGRNTPRPWLPKTASKDRPQQQGDHSAVYHSSRWVKVRRLVLQRDPICVRCYNAGVTIPSTVADHIIPINQGGPVWEMDNLQGMCNTCHAVKSAREGKAYKTQTHRAGPPGKWRGGVEPKNA